MEVAFTLKDATKEEYRCFKSLFPNREITLDKTNQVGSIQAEIVLYRSSDSPVEMQINRIAVALKEVLDAQKSATRDARLDFLIGNLPLDLPLDLDTLIRNFPLDVLTEIVPMSFYCACSLRHSGAKTLGELANFSRRQVLGCKDTGPKTLAEIESLLRRFGLALAK